MPLMSTQHRHLSAAFPNCYDDVRPTGERTCLISTLVAGDGLIDASHGNVIESPLHLPSELASIVWTVVSEPRPRHGHCILRRYWTLPGAMLVMTEARTTVPVSRLMTTLHIPNRRSEMQAILACEESPADTPAIKRRRAAAIASRSAMV
jgi:hypothetical protein